MKLAIQQYSKIIAGLIVFIILVLTILRENVFLEINAIIDGYNYNNAYFYFFNEHFSKLPVKELVLLKWVLTIIFIGSISACSVFAIHLWFRNKQYNKTTIFIYLILFGITALITLLLKVTGQFTDYYFVVRKMIGFLQSPLPLFLFFIMYLYLADDKYKPL